MIIPKANTVIFQPHHPALLPEEGVVKASRPYPKMTAIYYTFLAIFGAASHTLPLLWHPPDGERRP
jgi:hypothetical protein